MLPAILGVFGAGDLRVLRLLRLLRMLKLIRHSTTFTLLFAVLREEARSIAALLFVLMLTVTISGSLMYMLEGEEQPAVFSSIPAAMWWAIETLTTVGYGDMVPMTAVGRIVGGVVSIVGIGTLALFSGLITVGFLDQLKKYHEQHPRVTVAVSATSISVASDHGGRGGDRRDLTLIAANGPQVIAVGRSICPHCGSALSHPALRGDGRVEPFGA